MPDYDVRTYIPPDNVYGILAAPPCTMFSIARNHKLKKDFEKDLEIVFVCTDIITKVKPLFFAIENPVGYLKRWLGKPRYSFQPWWFGDPWSKRTLLWGIFNIPQKHHNNWKGVSKISELYIRPGREKPSMAFLHKSAQKYIPSLESFTINDDASFRAITPPGFAKAFFEANK